MNDTDQRVAIAKLMRFTDIDVPNSIAAKEFDLKPHGYILDDNEVIYPREKLPDYLNDLNAIDLARFMLIRNMDQRNKYEEQLVDLLGNLWNAIHATARQRAKALLKSLDKWVESEN